MQKPLTHLTTLALAISLTACASQTSKDNDAEETAVIAEQRAKQEQLAKAKRLLKESIPSQPEVATQEIVVTGSRIRSEVASPRLVQSFADASHTSMPVFPLQPLENITGENYDEYKQSGIKDVLQEPVSTFSIDVDTGSYSNMRRILNDGMMPPKAAIRTEELINYFDYAYQAPKDINQPFLVNSQMLPAPWNAEKHLLQIGIKAWEQPEQTQRPAANLVFLVDVSGSMNQANKLPLLKKSLLMLSKQLSADDRISLVVYAGASGVVLEPTAGNDYLAIESALNSLHAGGSTNGEAGINLAYQMAQKGFIKDGINRILLATDGDFNVGQSSTDALVELIEQKRDKGVSLSTLGFGTGNYNDHLMEQLANNGNGSCSYIDSLLEARKVLVDELDSQLITVAADVKLQLEFNPQHVTEYRLIGYENRTLAREDFNNDQVDAGEIGAGHTVTAIYEVTLASSEQRSMEPLRYQQQKVQPKTNSDELAYMRIRYKEPGQTKSKLIESALKVSELTMQDETIATDAHFSAAVVAFADKLRGGKYTSNFSYDDIQKLVFTGKGQDKNGLRAEFGRLVKLAQSLDMTES